MTRSILARRITPIVLFLLVTVTAGSLCAQAPEEKPAPAKAEAPPEARRSRSSAAEPSGVFEIYRVKYAKPDDIFQMARPILAAEAPNAMLALDQRTSSILVQGSREAQQKVAELLEKIDVPVPAKESSQIKIFTLQYLTPSWATRMLGAIGPKDVQIAPGETSRSLIVAGPPEALSVVEAVLMRLDQEVKVPSYQVRIIWLASGPAAESGGEPPSEDLKDVVGELARLGIKDPRQVGQMVVRTTLESRFEAKSSPRFGDQMAQFSASGMLLEQPRGMQIQLRTRKESAPEGQDLNEVSTQMIVPPRQYVVLATAPVGNVTSIFVVQVTDTPKAGN